ncbi:hypothetical protein A5642_27475 [Mycolicibacterium mucogenicum]|jgi:hypothetical protein|uniref:Uncharacterized protein n=1 Tax=Mycolicibacterium mucogenicum TaxID=56689 RepID=A0A1A0MA74_MYCMU|nr:hypothetical protein [Mycolicibacterium mucogenicum]OBA82300.1 hypothetical protein A5642_27475 [Mycolicibacterium mucogenicum]
MFEQQGGMGVEFRRDVSDFGIQGRLGEAHEIAAVAASLASHRSPLLIAAAIVADGADTAS